MKRVAKALGIVVILFLAVTVGWIGVVWAGAGTLVPTSDGGALIVEADGTGTYIPPNQVAEAGSLISDVIVNKVASSGLGDAYGLTGKIATTNGQTVNLPNLGGFYYWDNGVCSGTSCYHAKPFRL